MSSTAQSGPNRRQVLKGAAVLGGTAAAGLVGWRVLSNGAEPRRGGEIRDELDKLADAVRQGGPGKDGIPPIDRPRFGGIGAVPFLHDDDVVFGLSYRGEHRAYPQLVLVWHEIVNDTVAGDPISVTYCPLTGTTVGFTSILGEHALSFGTTGNLVNSNLLMYDRSTDSQWPQILGTAIAGTLKGTRLTTHPLVWTTWRRWRESHPDTQVLTTDTGALRNYGSDPYGSYRNRSGYYFQDGVMFSPLRRSDLFPPKTVVMGVRHNDRQLAIEKELIRRDGEVRASIGNHQVLARWDPQLDTATIVDADSGEPADYMDAMWFAWFAFYPDTSVAA